MVSIDSENFKISLIEFKMNNRQRNFSSAIFGRYCFIAGIYADFDFPERFIRSFLIINKVGQPLIVWKYGSQNHFREKRIISTVQKLSHLIFVAMDKVTLNIIIGMGIFS